MKPVECTCNPDAHHRITSTDAKLLRRVRKDTLARAKRLRGEGDIRTAVCGEWTAHLCLLRLRGLKAINSAELVEVSA